jgi:hypothetical protein
MMRSVGLRLSTSSMTISTCCVRSTAASLLLCVCHTSPAVASVSLTLFYHSGRLPRSWLRLFRCATSPAMCLLSLTVVSHSRRAIFGCDAEGVEFAVPGVASGSGVFGVWLIVVLVWVGCWRLSFLHCNETGRVTTGERRRSGRSGRSHIEMHTLDTL